MSIDAMIIAVRWKVDKTELWLRSWKDREGFTSISGRERLTITRNSGYNPQLYDHIWGNASECVIRWGGVDYKFRRIMKTVGGGEEIL